jgi:hypothetical protein
MAIRCSNVGRIQFLIGFSYVRLDEHLTVCFRPVMTRQCAVSGAHDSPELEAFPIRRPEAFLPKWLAVDFRHGNWSGEFGF